MNKITIAILVLGLMGFFFSLLLALLSKKLKVEEDPQTARVLDLLPGLNCGACGFSGCRAYAETAIKECDVFNGCLPAGTEVNKTIAELLGITGCVSSHKQVAICRCGAKKGEKKASSRYIGPNTCKSAHLTGGVIDCIYGCIGFGDCLEVCPMGAITLLDQCIHIDIEKCTGCGKCLKSCPRNLFEIVPLSETKSIDLYSVACSNTEKALAIKKVCSHGCIGCGICVRVENSPYYLKDNLSLIDYKKTDHPEALEQGKNKCPTKCIIKLTNS